MSWWLLGIGLMFVAVVLYRLDHYVEWRRANPGKHQLDAVPSRDDDEPDTDVFPIVAPESVDEDESFYRLERAVRRWMEYTTHDARM